MAEPGPDTGRSGQEPEVGTGPERINGPGDTNVNILDYHLRIWLMF